MSIANGISRKLTKWGLPSSSTGDHGAHYPKFEVFHPSDFPCLFQVSDPDMPMPVFSFPTSLWVAKDTDYIPCTSGSSFGCLYD